MDIFSRRENTNDPYEGIHMGDKAKDTLSGFTGVVIARSEHLTGCNQVFILPTSDKKNELNEGSWFDIERVEKIKSQVVKIKSRLTGCDVPAPSRSVKSPS